MADYLRLKTSNCKNCYKCIRHCPVKSIRFSGNQAHIVEDECILCGTCFVVCPQNAKEISDSTETVKVMLQGKEPVIASVAPSFIANWNGVGIASLEKELKKLGFAGAEETAVGASIVKSRYENILKDQRPDILISSCCHSVNMLIQKYFPDVLPYLADVVSPMQAHSMDIKRRYPNAKTVFFGPCVAKKDEAVRYPGVVDAVMTYKELQNWFDAAGIKPETSKDITEESRSRLFPTTGGILKSMTRDQSDYTYMAVDGAENCIAALKDIQQGGLKHCFIEMSACAGSCIGGPVMEKYHCSPIRNYMEILSYAGRKDFCTTAFTAEKLIKGLEYTGREAEMPSDSEISQILLQMGKTKPEHELNCGSCGYDTCREKAVAVHQGKADLTMCLPFLRDKAESFSGSIVNNVPNGILVLNENLEVQQINRSACKILNISYASDVMGEPVIRIMDPKDFMNVLKSGRNIRDQKVYLAEYKKYVEKTILYDRDFHRLICIMRDVTEKQRERDRKETVNKQTIEIADKVVERQMRIVQEIASLLGETAAETKIALTNLKESISNE